MDACLLEISGFSGPLCSITADATWCIRDVRLALEVELGLPRGEQRLLSGTRELGEADPIGSLITDRTASLTLLRCRPEELEWLARVQLDWLSLSRAPRHIQEDKEVVLAAVLQNGLALQFAKGALLGDRELVSAAVEQNGFALQFASDRLREDRDLVLSIVQKDGLALETAHPDLRADREIVVAACRQNKLALHMAAKSLWADPELVCIADEARRQSPQTNSSHRHLTTGHSKHAPPPGCRIGGTLAMRVAMHADGAFGSKHNIDEGGAPWGHDYRWNPV
eukprot:TRINITY_DN57715_c0_g1_i1.p1 TRINITY_DN57715_c0_g1~~TRINITY_DN57715_c0_g1_i1.p1  ORF type:complete len:281 (-),score=46.92 TRINITY_DN57715_c0_g1_i1:1-843(-)